jgi:ankyrin repeat protein
MKIFHSDLMTLGVLLGYNNHKDGICAGFTGMWMQAALAQDEPGFYKRLAFIATYKNNLPKLVAEIKEAQKKENTNLSAKDKQLVDIINFFDGMELYLYPRLHRNHFSDSRNINQADLKAIFSHLKPLALEKSELDVLLDKNYTFTKVLLSQFFDDIAKQLSQTTVVIPICLSSDEHSICLKYDSQKSCWYYLDTEDFKTFPDDDNYCRELNTQALVDSVFHSFETSSYAVFNTMLLTIQTDETLKDNLHQLNLNYPIAAEQINNYNDKQVSLLHLACQRGNLEDVKEIMKPEYQADINARAKGRGTPLHLACQNGYTNLVKELLKPDNKTNINEVNNEGLTPFYLACQNGHSDIVRELMKPEYKVDIFKARKTGTKPFTAACQNGHADIVKELMLPEHKVDINEANKKANTSFFLACHQGQVTVVKLFLESPLFRTLETGDQVGNTPLLIACISAHTKYQKDLFRALLKKGASLTHKNEENQSALDLAFCSSNPAAIFELLQRAKKKNYPHLSIMSLKTLEKAKKLAINYPEFKLTNYLHNTSILLNKKRSYFFNESEEAITKKVKILKQESTSFSR